MELKSKMLFNEFELIEKIGEGGQGVVWLARETFLDLKVALKILPMSFNDDQLAKIRFDREIKIQAKLNHPCIVKALKSGYANDHFYFAMDYVSGYTLDYYLDKGCLEERDSWKIALKVCEALDYAYTEHQLIHRDIKPSNIIIDDDMNVFILDLGLSMARDNNTDLTQTGFFVGTPKYMSPEQIRDGDLNCQTDIYSLGVTIYKMLCGRTPFESENTIQLIAKISLEQPEPIRTYSPELSEESEMVLEIMLQKETEDRYTNWKSLSLDINALLDNKTPIYATSKNINNTFYMIKPEVAMRNKPDIDTSTNSKVKRDKVDVKEKPTGGATTIRKRKPIKINMTDKAVGTQKYSQRQSAQTKRRHRSPVKKRSAFRILIEVSLAVLVGIAALVILYNQFYTDLESVYANTITDQDERVNSNNQNRALITGNSLNPPIEVITTDSGLVNFEAKRLREQRLVDARRDAMLTDEAKRQQALRRQQLVDNAKIAELEAERVRRSNIPVPNNTVNVVRQPIKPPEKIVISGYYEKGTYRLKKNWLTYKDAFYSIPKDTKINSIGWWFNNPFISTKEYSAIKKVAFYRFKNPVSVFINARIVNSSITYSYTGWQAAILSGNTWQIRYNLYTKNRLRVGELINRNLSLTELIIDSNNKKIIIAVKD